MSFSAETKEALCGTSPKPLCCKLALLYGYLYCGKEFSAERIAISFESEKIKEYISKLFFDIFSIDLEDSNEVVIDDNFTLDMLSGVMGTDGSQGISEIVYTCTNCSKAFIKGIFLSCGSITDPAKGYHLEFSGLGESRTGELAGFFALQGLETGYSQRKGKPVLYYKSTQLIERFLSYIGASKGLFGVINARMIGEQRNAINRVSNFENANLNRTVSAASDQVRAAKKLKRTGKLSLLPEELQESAVLRMQNPNASLTELAAMHSPPISKSGLTHRLKRLVILAKEEQ